jgi:hypothetical protein
MLLCERSSLLPWAKIRRNSEARVQRRPNPASASWRVSAGVVGMRQGEQFKSCNKPWLKGWLMSELTDAATL